MSTLLMMARRRGVIGVGGVVTPFFQDDFSNGQVNPAGGFVYSNSRGTLDQSEVVAVAGEGLASTDGATYVLRTRYPGQPPDGQGANGQVNFALGRSLPEVWMEWRFYIPTNYIHRDQPTETENNKFMTLWGGGYSAGTVTAMCELTRGPAGESDTRPMIRHSGPTIYRPTVTAGQLTNILLSTEPRVVLISPTGPVIPGTWNTVRFYTKRETSSLAYDGIWRMWVNGVKIRDFTGLPHGVAPGSGNVVDFDSGYFWGASNSNFDDPTNFYIRYHRWYDTDPGWV
jgi:hypothetical protein